MRSKLLLWLIIYFMGFCTAIYVLAPVHISNLTQNTVRTNEIIEKVNVGMKQIVCFAGKKTTQLSEIIKTKLPE